MTRRVLFWRPEFEAGLSRQKSIDGFRATWQEASVDLAARRGLEVADERDPAVVQRCAEWLDRTRGKRLQDKSVVHVVVISDPLWEADRERMIETARLMNDGAGYGATQPMALAIAVEDGIPLAAESWQELLTALKASAREKAPREAAGPKEWLSRCLVGSWEFIMTLSIRSADAPAWHLSAMIWPRGRTSTDDDWKFLGQASMFLGAPKEPIFTDPENPKAPVHWDWPAAASDVPQRPS